MTDVLEAENASSASSLHQIQNAKLRDYLLDNSPIFRKLDELRQKGWNNPAGDEYFRQQRANADDSTEKNAQGFYQMMIDIGRELQISTDAFSISDGVHNPRILDLCMAPGGFLRAALDANPESSAVAFTLPREDGGHRVLLEHRESVTLTFLDITMLAGDMGVHHVPVSHPEAKQFLGQKLGKEKFNLVLCDGQVLRTHQREAYREPREACRLGVTQLALGLEHLQPGGTMIVLLHKVEIWENVCLLRKLSEFSTVKLFKPRRAHRKRSSFYLIASNVQSESTQALRAIDEWRSVWKAATFGMDKEYYAARTLASLDLPTVLADFGEELVVLGESIWANQANALAVAPFVTGARKRTEYCR